MSTISVYDMSGAETGTVDLSGAVRDTAGRRQVIHEAVVAYLANQRSGSANTRNKNRITASNAKPWRQKGSGRARAGYRSSPVWRGGGVAFGPKPRSYRKQMNRKTARLAFALAFSERLQADGIVVLDELSISEPKTKHVAGLLKALKIEGPALLVVDKADANLALATRNLPKVELTTAREMNTYQAVRYTRVVITQAALREIEERVRPEEAKAQP